jgi:hypothetical protein
MSDQRECDLKPFTRFRASRFFNEGCEWYFLTRESTIEGPFEHKIDAAIVLGRYINLMMPDFIGPRPKLLHPWQYYPTHQIPRAHVG